jgi:hypothetical protein
VAIELATLHVAGLTTPRGAGDETDAPFLLISVIRPHAQSTSHLPASGHWRLAEDAVVTPTAVDLLELAPGDSARVVIAVLESEGAEPAPELASGVTSAKALSELGQPLLDPAGPALGAGLDGLNQAGVHRVGAISLLVTNEGGTLWWRRMDCVQDCAVLMGIPDGTGTVLSAPTNGVYELTGAGGTYHLNLSLKAVN